MNHAITQSTRPSSEGAATVERLHDAWRTGRLTIVRPSHSRSLTSDPLLLDDGIPTLTQRQAARHHRSAPHVHLVHRVDTETDLPPDVDGVAIGHAALTRDNLGDLGDIDGDQYQAEPIVPVDHELRAFTWSLFFGAYGVAALMLVAIVVFSRNQPAIRAGLDATERALAALFGA